VVESIFTIGFLNDLTVYLPLLTALPEPNFSAIDAALCFPPP
jgi:hypothetical protein